MNAMPLESGLLLALILFAVGMTGLLVRRNIIFMLMSIEIMLNAAAFAFVLAGAYRGQTDGQVMFIFILVVAAAEAAVGLALILQLYKRFKSLDVDVINKMRG